MADDAPRCCGRQMSGIGVATGDGVLLHSCASCGRHAWSAQGRELDRDALIELLRDDAASSAAAPVSTPSATSAPVVLPDSAPTTRPTTRPTARARRPRTVPAPAADDRRSELQDLLRGFTVHGGSS